MPTSRRRPPHSPVSTLTTLSPLPLEIIHKIFEYLKDPDDKPVLAVLVRTCKRVYHECWRLLYARVRLNTHNVLAFHYGMLGGPEDRIIPLTPYEKQHICLMYRNIEVEQAKGLTTWDYPPLDVFTGLTPFARRVRLLSGVQELLLEDGDAALHAAEGIETFQELGLLVVSEDEGHTPYETPGTLYWHRLKLSLGERITSRMLQLPRAWSCLLGIAWTEQLEARQYNYSWRFPTEPPPNREGLYPVLKLVEGEKTVALHNVDPAMVDAAFGVNCLKVWCRQEIRGKKVDHLEGITKYVIACKAQFDLCGSDVYVSPFFFLTCLH
ncbi:hypothetical protein IAT38_005364 [Cryptococcus sp. DSM 104549]